MLQMSADIPEVRPPIIRKEIRHCLEISRGFRYVVRNADTFQLNFSRVEELIGNLRSSPDSAFKDPDNFAQTFINIGETYLSAHGDGVKSGDAAFPHIRARMCGNDGGIL